MTQAQLEFNPRKGLALKQRGMELAAARSAEILERARRIAVSLAHEQGTVDSDAVLELMPEVQVGNWVGSIFCGGRWERVGFIRSRRPSAHGRYISNWRLRR